MPFSVMVHHVALVRTDIVFLGSMLWLVTANVVPSSSILVTLMMEAIRSSETLVLTRATWCKIGEYSIFFFCKTCVESKLTLLKEWH
jgi:hypothetical protein